MGHKPSPFSINRNNMSNTCLNKLSGNITVDCGIPKNGVQDLYLMHVEDVTLGFDQYGNISGITFAKDAKSYRIEGYKQNIQVTITNRALDASNKLDISIMFKSPTEINGANTNVHMEKSILANKFYVLVVTGVSGYYMVGDISPLECTGYDCDSNANGKLATITLSAPDGSSGNYRRFIISPAVVDTIKSKAI